jgi:hypothetical protein
MIDKTEIEFKVMGENKVNSILNEVMPLILKELNSYKGLQVIKRDLTLLKKIKDKTDLILKEVKMGELIGLYIGNNQYDLILNVKLRFDLGKGWGYYEGFKYICSIDSLTLKDFYEFKEFEVINLDEQINIFENCLKLKDQLNEELRKLNPYSLGERLK